MSSVCIFVDVHLGSKRPAVKSVLILYEVNVLKVDKFPHLLLDLRSSVN